MKKLISIIFVIGLMLSFTKSVNADNIAGSSAVMKKYINDPTIYDKKRIFKIKKTIRNVLEKYNSPLASQVDSFVDACQTYDLDCYLLPSIAGLESTFGRFIWPNSNNPFGWGGGMIMFDDWNKGILIVAKGLRNNYINKGAESLEDIGHIYSESSTWTIRVQYFIQEFRNEESNLQLFLSKNEVQL
ncbi:MAG: hypothetical protein Q7R95_03265 [bacterium]|nr:hypothetical protein [bacterium]